MTTKKEITNLAEMKLNELQAKYAEVLERKPAATIRRSCSARSLKHCSPQASAPVETERQPQRKHCKRNTCRHAAHRRTTAVAEHIAETVSENVSEKLTKLTVPELQARYLEVVRRPTGSSNSAYLIWKIREARKGRVAGWSSQKRPARERHFKILPLRMEAAVVDKLDEAWKRQGLHSRMDLFRKSLHDYLACVGENEVAALLTDAVSREQ